MEHLTRSLKVVWRSERLIKENELRLMSQKMQLNAMAGLVGLFGLVMLSMAAFFAIVPYWGQALAALTVAGIDIVLAILLIARAGSLKPAPEVKLVAEMRDMALADIEDELALAEQELIALKNEVQGFVKNPMDTLLPTMIGPLLAIISRTVLSPKNQP